jgi:thiol-disulfide isomerase/thioredoxin
MLKHYLAIIALSVAAALLSQHGLTVCGIMGCTCKDKVTAVGTCCCGDKCDCCQCCPSCPCCGKETAQSYPDAKQQAQASGKKLLLTFGAKWCGPCQQMHKVYADAEVQKAMGLLVTYECDVDKDKATARKFNVSGIPAYMLIDATTEKAVKKGTGYRSPKDFVVWLGGQQSAATDNGCDCCR